MAPALPQLRDVALDDKYELESGRVYLTGAQAFVRLLMLQRQRDQLAGLNTGGFVSAVEQFLSAERGRTHLKAYAVDPYSENTEADIDDGQWTVSIRVETYSMAEQIILKAQIGETVTVS